jgi:DNA-binding Lrp family transcriptional regulator
MQPPVDPTLVPNNLFKRGRSDRGATSIPESTGKAFPTVKAVAILEAMATAGRPLGISEFGVLLGLPKPTAHRIVRMLESEGLLQREPGSSRYVPGARLERLGLDIVAASMSRAPRHAILESLSQEIGETCNFASSLRGRSGCGSNAARAFRSTARRWANCFSACCPRTSAR